MRRPRIDAYRRRDAYDVAASRQWRLLEEPGSCTMSKKTRTIFVIMPFRSSPSRDKGQLTSFFENVLKKPIEEAGLQYQYRVHRSDETFNINEKIIKDLFDADIVIADLSGELPNPNVMYELGVRLALSREPVILIREDHKDNEKVFDIAHFYIHEYDPLAYPGLQEHVLAKLRRFESGEESYESPVRKVLSLQLAVADAAFSKLSPGEQRGLVLTGLRSIAATVADAFGPDGSGVSCSADTGSILVRRGSDITERLRASNPVEQLGFEFARRITSKVSDLQGDGSSTTLLLALGMIDAAEGTIASGLPRPEVIRGINKASDRAIQSLVECSVKADGDALFAVLRTACRIESIAESIRDLFTKVKGCAQVWLEDGDERTDEIIIENGFALPRCSVKPGAPMATEATILKGCYVLVCRQAMSSIRALVPLLEKVAKKEGKLLILTPDIGEEVQAMIAVNNDKRIVACAAVRVPDLEGRLGSVYEYLATFCGATLIPGATGRSLDEVSLDDLGTAAEVRLEVDSTRILGGGGDSDAVANAITSLERLKQKQTNEYARNKIAERQASLGWPTAVVRIGGETVNARLERRYAWESGLSSRVSADCQGVVAGGGAALIAIRDDVRKCEAATEGETAGVNAVLDALRVPLSTLARNAGRDPDEALKEIEQAASPEMGVEATTGKIQNLREQGILDSTSTLTTGIRMASMFAKEFLETGSWNVPEQDKDR